MADLVADLSSFPPASHRLVDEAVLGLMWLIDNARVAPNELSTVKQIVMDRVAMLDAELKVAPVFLDALIKAQVSHQLRVRCDFETAQLAVEQWVPAVGAWLVSGYFPQDASGSEIVANLLRNDPRRQTPEQAFADTRTHADTAAKTRDSEGSERVLAAVDGLSSKALGTFLEVEGALRSGETILAHGDDARFIQKAIDKTTAAAREGDIEAQRVITNGGQFDTALCVNPGDNPAIRK